MPEGGPPAATGDSDAAGGIADHRDAWRAWGRSADTLPTSIGAGLDATLGRQPRWALLAEAALLLGAFAVFDYVTGYEINLSIFYLVPVIFLTWFVSRRAGIVMATLAIGLWAVVEFASGLRYSHSFYPVWNGAVRLTFFLIVVQLVHIMKDARAREAELARTDSLTGVANGRSFSDRAEFELAILRRTKHPLTMAYVDLDRFKHVNDTLGHTEGDRLLRAAAHAIQSRLRATDLVARLGGDEFGILLPDTDRHAAPAAIAAISEAVREVVDGSWDAGCTIGAMTFEMAPESVDFMVRSADELMYRGKRTGRGCVVHDVWPSKLMERPGSTTPPTC